MNSWQALMRRTWVRIADGLTHRAGAVMAVALLVSVVLAFGATKLKFATGQDSYLNKTSQIAKDNQAYQNLFGGEAMITVFTMNDNQSIVNLFTQANNQKMRDLETELGKIPGVQAAITPLASLEWSNNLVEAPPGQPSTASPAGEILARDIAREPAGSPQAAARTADGIKTLQREAASGEPSLSSPSWVKFLMFDNSDPAQVRTSLRPSFPVPPGKDYTEANATRALMLTRLDGNQSIEQEGKAATAVTKAIEAVHFDGATTLTTGSPVLLKDINDYLQGGMLVLGAIAVVVMIVVLSLAFRVRWRLIPLAVMVLGVVWTFGLLGYSGFQLSLVTIAGLPILIGLGVEFAIQVHNRVEEEVVVDRMLSPFAESISNIGPALSVATVAAVLAVLALLASQVPMIREFGILLALGIVMVFAAAIVVPVTALSVRERRSPTTVRKEQRIVEASMVRLGKLPQFLVVPLVLVAVALFAGGLYFEEQTPIQTDPQQWVNQSSQTVKDLNSLEDQTNVSSELGVYTRVNGGPPAPTPGQAYVAPGGGVFTDQMGQFVTQLGVTELQRYPTELVDALSLATTVYYLSEVPGASQLYPTGEDLWQAYEVAPKPIQESMVAADGTAANLSFLVGNSSLEQRKVIVDDIRSSVAPGGSIPAPEGVTATPSGLAVIGVGLLDSLTANRLLLTVLAIAAVAVWLLIRFTSFVKAFLTLIPVLLAVGLASTVVWASHITVSPLTTVSGPLVIAICTEFATLILFRHLEERRQGLSPREAVDVAAARTGRAFFASALTTVGGFAVLLFSPLPLLRDFGAIVAITIAIALLSAVTVLPPVLIWADERGWVRLGPGAEPVDESVPVSERAARPNPPD